MLYRYHGKFGFSDFGTFGDPEHSPEEGLLSYHPSCYLPPLPLLHNTDLKAPITIPNKFAVSTHLLYTQRQGLHQRYKPFVVSPTEAGVQG